MQTDVKVFIPELLVDIFPGLTVKVVKGEFLHYNLHVTAINSEQIIKLADVCLHSNVDLSIHRYGKGMTIKFLPKAI